jgi:hypothetical protein
LHGEYNVELIVNEEPLREVESYCYISYTRASRTNANQDKKDR